MSSIASQLDARECASLFLTKDVSWQLPQTRERIDLLRAWTEPSAGYAGYDLNGKTVIELGCGQGDCTTVLGKAMQLAGGGGKLFGVDPGRPDYGAPYTLAQAQDFIAKGPLKDIVSFERATGPEFLQKHSGRVDALVMAHCIYYMPSVEALNDVFASCRKSGIETLLLAEWALTASRLESVPHVLAVLTQAIHPAEEGNIRTVFTPQTITEMALANGYELSYEQTIPSPEMQDGQWEVDIARDLVKETLEKGEAGQEKRDLALKTHLDALNASIPGDGKLKNVRCMDVWAASFRLARS